MAKNAVTVIFVLLIIFSTKDTLGAARPLGDMKTNNVSFPKDRVLVPPSGPDPCTQIPKPRDGHCN
jgi:hypothetical protein